jgi:flagellar assembly protein FliH
VIRRDRLRLVPPAPPPPAPAAPAAAKPGVPDEVAAWQAKAEEALARARAAAVEEGRRAGHADGFTRGLEEGRRRGREEAARQALDLLHAVEAEIRQRRHAAEAELGQLALEIASHLLGVAIAADPSLVARSVSAVVQEAAEMGVVEVVVAPEDMPAAQLARAEWAVQWAGDAEVRLRPDAALCRGECRVETRQGGLGRHWPTRLAELAAAFREAAAALPEPAAEPAGEASGGA